MRAFRWLVLLLLLAGLAVVAFLAWLGRTEEGSRWLVDTTLSRLPFAIEATDVRGTLLEGLDVAHLQIELPVARIVANDIRLDWQPAGLLAGRIVLEHLQIGDLAVDVIPSDEPPDPDADLLFWLRLPVDVYIKSGRIDALRVQKAEFTQLETRAALGWGRLRLDYIAAAINGVHMRLRGTLAGAYPGRLDAMAEWRWPEGGLAGAGRFGGDVENTVVTHVVRVPEAIAVEGMLTDLLSKPAVKGKAEWASVALPGSTPLVSRAGRFLFSSDFVSVVFSGKSIIRQDAQPDIPVTLAAEARLDGIDIRAFEAGVFGGRLNGTGALDYRAGLSGSLTVAARQIDIESLRPGLPGALDFDAQIDIASVADLTVDISALEASLSGQTVTGTGRVDVRDGQLAGLSALLAANGNRLTADIGLQPALRGTVVIDAPELAGLYPDLQGRVAGRASLGGTLDQPRARVTATAGGLQLKSLQASDLNLDFELTAADRLRALLEIKGLASDDLALGELQIELAGSLSEHTVEAKLTGDVVDAELSTAGGWNGTQLDELLLRGRIGQAQVGEWQLADSPRLQIDAAAVRLGSHCWQQQAASACIGDTRRAAGDFSSSLELTDWPLAAFAPLLPAGLTVEGNANASVTARADAGGWRGDLRWRQRDTVLSYLVDGELVSTTLESVVVDVASDPGGANLAASIVGDNGLFINGTARLDEPPGLDSALDSRISGKLADISIVRPWLLQVIDTGAMEGAVDLDMRISGTLRRPVFSGGAYLRDGVLQLPDAGITLKDIDLQATSAGGATLALAGKFRSGEGIASIGGDLGVSPAGGLLANVSVRGTDLQTVRLPELNLDSSPDLAIRVDESGINISGSLQIPKAVARIRTLPGSVTQKSADVVVHTADSAERTNADETLVTGDVTVVLGDDVRFYGFGLESRLDGSLRLRQKPRGALRGTGAVRVRDGFLTGYGKELRVDRGTLNFTGPLDDPGVNVQVSRDAIYEGRQYTIGLRLTGTASNVITTPFSRPSMSDRDVLAFLLLDRPASSSGEDTGLSGAALALGLGKMLPGGEGGVVSTIGLDEVSFEGSELEQTAVVAGKRITDDLYVRYAFGLFGEPGSFRIRYRLGRGFSVESSAGLNQAVDIIYVVEKD